MQESARDMPRGIVQMHISDIPFSEIPHQSRLFLEYQLDPLSLKRFYPNAVSEADGLDRFAGDVLGNYSVDRSKVCDALEQANNAAGAGAATFQNIQRLRDADCTAVLTGQQAGLFSGPLYTIYKALSAVRLAEELSKAGIKAVPVFWAATEDHDLAEIATTFGPGPVTFTSEASVSGAQIGSIVLGEEIGGVIDQLFSAFPRSEFTDELRSGVESSYRKGVRLGDAFLKLLANVFSELGIIFIDPMDATVRELSAPIIASAIERSDVIGGALQERTAELEAGGYLAQVAIEEDHFPLFWIDDAGKRTALRRDGDFFRVKGSRTTFTRPELVDVASSTPERLSPAVMLRPVVQDFLLPTVAYIGGAAEIAYFAQNAVVYEQLERPVTPILHRQSFTVVEPKYRRTLEKYNLEFQQLFSGREEVALAAAGHVDSQDTAALFTGIRGKFGSELDRLQSRLSTIDATVAANLATRSGKIMYHLDALEKKALLATLRNDETAERRLNDLFETLLPGGGLQERRLNVLYFLNKYGPNFISWIYEATDVNKRGHRVIDLQ